VKRISAPAFPAVSADQLREWLRLDPDVDADTLDLLLGSAVDHVQALTGQIVVSADYETVLHGPGCHVITISNSTAVALFDQAGDPITDIDIVEASVHGDLVFVEVLPADRGPVTVRVTAGWTTEEMVPASLRHAIAVYVGAAYDSRHAIDDATLRTVAALCQPFRRIVI